MVNRALRLTRIIISAIIFVVLTIGLTAPALALPLLLPLLVKIQLVTALAAFSITTFVGWLMVTLMFGRIYCSSVCPLGTLQDIAALRHRSPYRYSPPRNNLRYIFLVTMLICLMLQNAVAVTILDPYSEFAGFCTFLFAPLFGSNGAPSALLPIPGTILAIVVFASTLTIAARRGRLACNTVCPVGTALGLVSRFAVFHIEIDTDKCIQCRRCVDVCKSSCINLADHLVDGSRCVNCFDCINVCPNDAIHYTGRRKQLSDPMMQRIPDPFKSRSRTAQGATGATCSKPENPSLT